MICSSIAPICWQEKIRTGGIDCTTGSFPSLCCSVVQEYVPCPEMAKIAMTWRSMMCVFSSSSLHLITMPLSKINELEQTRQEREMIGRACCPAVGCLVILSKIQPGRHYCLARLPCIS